MRRTLMNVITALALPACGDAAAEMSASAPGDDDGQWPGADAGNGTSAPGGGDDGAEPPPPENELDFDLRTPEAGERYLFVPSASLDALIAVDGRDLRVHLVEVGLSPTIVRALPGQGGAVVLNEGSSDLTIVRYDAEAPDPGFSADTLPVADGANRLELSPDGAWAFAWHDARVASAGTSDAATLQDVTAVRLTPGDEAAFNLAVGYQPTGVQFADEDRLALIACDNGLSVVDLDTLDGDVFLPPIPTTADVFRPMLERELVPTPDGGSVVVRDLQYAELLWLDLATRERHRLALPDFPSDLDLTPDGERLLVPLRARAQVAIVEVPEAFLWAPPPDAQPVPDNPHVRFVPSGGPFGSLALTAGGEGALLYTTQAGVSAVGLLDLEGGEVTLLPLVKEVEAVSVAPTGAVAALQLRKGSGTGAIRDREAYALLDLASGYVKVVATESRATMFSFTRDGSELFALLPDPLGARHAVHRVSSATFATRTYPVPDAPTFVGSMPQISKMAISLDNPTGWITFVDTETDEVTQLNSFELNGFIR
jgi:hypothetical protein